MHVTVMMRRIIMITVLRMPSKRALYSLSTFFLPKPRRALNGMRLMASASKRKKKQITAKTATKKKLPKSGISLQQAINSKKLPAISCVCWWFVLWPLLAALDAPGVLQFHTKPHSRCSKKTLLPMPSKTTKSYLCPTNSARISRR